MTLRTRSIRCLLWLAALALPVGLHAQENSLKGKHEISAYGSWSLIVRKSVASPYYLNGYNASTWRTTFKNHFMPGIGYRYFLSNRVAIGADVLASWGNDLYYYYPNPDYTNPIKQPIRDYSITFIPSVTYIYYRRGLVRLYGGAGIGAGYSVYSAKALGNLLPRYDSGIEMAFNLTPIGMRLGNERIGGFVELGLGGKGLVSAGVTMTF